MTGFEPGKSYVAAPTVPGHDKIVLTCAGKENEFVTFVRIRELYHVRVCGLEGRQFAKIAANNGVDYTLSSAVEADINAAAVIMGSK